MRRGSKERTAGKTRCRGNLEGKKLSSGAKSVICVTGSRQGREKYTSGGRKNSFQRKTNHCGITGGERSDAKR